MKNKKGFTLVELLAVIVIISIVLIIFAPTLTNSINNKKQDASSTVEKLVLSSGRTYAIDNNLQVPLSIPIEELCNLANGDCTATVKVNWKEDKITYAMISSNYKCSNASAGSNPYFEYGGACTLIDDGSGNWRVKFTSSGRQTLKVNKQLSIDIFLVGGGGAGCTTSFVTGGGGGGPDIIKLLEGELLV